MAKLVLGTAQLGTGYGANNREGVLSSRQCIDLLKAAWNIGIRDLDTAEDYGVSESMIGAFHEENPEKAFNVCTKLSHSFVIDADVATGLMEHIESTTERLSVSAIDVYYLHSYEMCKNDALMHALAAARTRGLISKIGISIYEPEELRYILANLSGRIQVVQIPFSAFDCSRWLEDDLIHKASQENIDIYVRSIYLQGMAFKDPEDEKVRQLGFADALSAFDAIASEKGISRARLACDFVKDTDGVKAFVLGSETAEQAKDNYGMLQTESVWLAEERSAQLELSKKIPLGALDPRTW